MLSRRRNARKSDRGINGKVVSCKKGRDDKCPRTVDQRPNFVFCALITHPSLEIGDENAQQMELTMKQPTGFNDHCIQMNDLIDQ